MTEQTYSHSDAVPTDFDDAFDDWIGGATISKRSVPIYGKPGLFAEWEELEREYQLLEAQGETDGELAGSSLRRIEARMQELHNEWQESKSTWTVRGVDSDELDELKAQEPALVEPKAPAQPARPAPLPLKHTIRDAVRHQTETEVFEKAQVEYEAAAEVYETSLRAFSKELALRTIARAVVRVEFADGRELDSVTVAQVKRLNATLGDRQILSLANAATLAAIQETEIPAPFSRGTSSSDPTS